MDTPNENVDLLTSEARSATTTAEGTNNSHPGGHFIVHVSDVSPSVGVVEITAGDDDPATDEVQHVTVTASGGTFTLTYDSQTTSALAYNVSAADMETALDALSNIADGDVEVTGGPGDAAGTTPYVLSFAGALGDIDVELLTADGTSLTTSPSIVPKIQGKDPASNEWYDVLVGSAITTTGTTVLKVCPGITPTANASAADILPKTYRVVVTHADADAVTYSVGAVLVG